MYTGVGCIKQVSPERRYKIVAVGVGGCLIRYLDIVATGRRSLAGRGFFDQLKDTFKKEVEQNKEFKESLAKLKVCAATPMP
jgi:hypothetical protein